MRIYWFYTLLISRIWTLVTIEYIPLDSDKLYSGADSIFTIPSVECGAVCYIVASCISFAHSSTRGQCYLYSTYLSTSDASVSDVSTKTFVIRTGE